jgi:hypothetical protein
MMSRGAQGGAQSVVRSHRRPARRQAALDSGPHSGVSSSVAGTESQGEHVKNAAFGSEEELRQHREASIDQVERFQREGQAARAVRSGKDAGEKRGPGRPKGSKNDPGKNESKRPERIPPT